MPTIEKVRLKLIKTFCKERIGCQSWVDKKKLAELLANKKTIGLILGFLKLSDVDKKKEAKKQEKK